MFVAIVPAYNEERTIGSVVQSLFEHVDKVVVVDDFSSDNTWQKAKDAGAIVLRHEINRGQGAALQTGHDYACKIKADYVLHFDGDGQFCVEDIKSALEKLKQEKADILFGSRFLDNRSENPWFKRKILHPLAILFNKVFFGIKLSDAHNGFRILNKKALEKIKIKQDRMAHSSEIPALAVNHDLKIVEFPVKVVYREYGQRASGAVEILKDLLFDKFLR